MVSVFLYCSSPYVGYTLKQADYRKKEMRAVTENDMTPIGYKVFCSSGSFMVLGKFNGKKYFHTRQSQSENYDEQNRRIYTNAAFVGENKEDEKTINRIAAYALFDEEAFYKEITGMITLLDDGFSVDFDKLACFIKKFDSEVILETTNGAAQKLYKAIMAKGNDTITFIVTESTWSYFVKQVGHDFNDSVLYKLSFDDAESITAKAAVRFAPSKPDDKTDPPRPKAPKVPENKKTADDSVPDEKDHEIEKLRSDVNLICAERNNLLSEIGKLKGKISSVMQENTRLKDKMRMVRLTGILMGVIGTVCAVLIIYILRWIF